MTSTQTAPSFGVRHFRAEREADWQRLEALLDLVEKKSPRRLTNDDLVELPRLMSPDRLEDALPAARSAG